MTLLRLDYETSSEAQLVGPASVGLYNYATHPSTRALMLAWSFDNGPVQQVDYTEGDTTPPEVRDALLDPRVLKTGFNSQFERVITRRVLKIKTPIKGWRCTMVQAYMQSFTGDLAAVGEQLGLPASMVKDPEGKRLIRMFSVPQRVTKKQPLRWLNSITNPDDWQKFLDYNVRDVEAEMAIDHALGGFKALDKEWRLYEIDQLMNDRGLPVSVAFVDNANTMADRRRAELTSEMRDMTGLDNPNSGSQLIPWLQDNGYPFADLQKLTVKKVLADNQESEILTPACVKVLKLRQQASRTSVRKYPAIQQRLDRVNARLRYCFQFAGASRTNRWAGRGPQPHNLVRTPKALEKIVPLTVTTQAIMDNDYDALSLMSAEPMDALAGLMRSSFQATEPYEELVVADLSAIESAVIAWLSGCKRLLNVFASGLDPYKDFGVDLYGTTYDKVTSEQRTGAKPATLGCGFGLGGGDMRDGKKTGLWAYAEGMGVKISREEAHRQVKVFREAYPEIPLFWLECDRAARIATEQGKVVRICDGKLTFAIRGDYLTVELPSGRSIYYHRPKMKDIEYVFTNTDPLTGVQSIRKRVMRKFTCMGVIQGTRKWARIVSSGPKLCENFVQATAREVLGHGKITAHEYGFNIVGSVHDELIGLQKRGDNRYSPAALEECMTKRAFWMDGLPLKAVGMATRIYRKA